MTFSLTFPFSNLFTLFLQLTRHRSPESPWSPIRFRKTDASVPLPLTVPVQTVTLYLITETQNQSRLILLCIWQSRFWLLGVNTVAHTYRAEARRLVLRGQVAPSQPRYRLHLCPASAHNETHTFPSSKSSSELPYWKKATESQKH